MIKLIKLNTSYINESGVKFDVFMTINSDVQLVEYGDFILNYYGLNTPIEKIENFINEPSLNEEKIDVFLYKLKDFNTEDRKYNQHVYLFLLSAFREYQLGKIIQDEGKN